MELVIIKEKPIKQRLHTYVDEARPIGFVALLAENSFQRQRNTRLQALVAERASVLGQCREKIDFINKRLTKLGYHENVEPASIRQQPVISVDRYEKLANGGPSGRANAANMKAAAAMKSQMLAKASNGAPVANSQEPEAHEMDV